MDEKYRDITRNLGPTKVIVVLFIVGVLALYVHAHYPFGGSWFYFVYYTLAYLALGGFVVHMAHMLKMMMKWRREARHESGAV
ncbi:MAG: hypothetical protein JXA08_04220 [Methanomicrobiaceae archaeon]|nr:hypothetical protein [Methanomicrobiaceae archaeon]